MAKLSKAEAKRHFQAVEILKQDVLSEADKEFVFENWHEGAEFENGHKGAFFTPMDLAFDFALDCGGKRLVDLCAGIGALAYAAFHRIKHHNNGVAPEIVCIEQNPHYVEIGRKLLPEATWICASVFDWESLNLGVFDMAISNPPFGKVKRDGNSPNYKGAIFEFHVMDIASQIAKSGLFIVPQASASFKYSGCRLYEQTPTSKGAEFADRLGFEMVCGIGIDTAAYRDQWKGVSPLCEIVSIDFEDKRGQQDLFALAA